MYSLGLWIAADGILLFIYSTHRCSLRVSSMPVTVLGNHETKRRGRGLSSRGQILREVRSVRRWLQLPEACTSSGYPVRAWTKERRHRLFSLRGSSSPWTCSWKKTRVSAKGQRRGCPRQRQLPGTMPGLHGNWHCRGMMCSERGQDTGVPRALWHPRWYMDPSLHG